MAEKTSEALSLEAKFDKLDEIVEALEGDNVSLEKSFELYKQGMDYIKECNEEISAVEQKVLLLKENGETDEF